MNNYRGQVRRQVDHTPTKSSWQNQKSGFQQIHQQKYSRKDYQKSELSYYQSQSSHTIYSEQVQKKVHSLQNKQLYDNLIPIKVSSCQKQQYSTYLRIQIINTVEKAMNKITLYLTDDRDPKFLWIFFIKENDFVILKKEQKLKVDFRAFPNMLMDHFDMCKNQKEAANAINNGQCYFFLLFQIKKNQGSLNILQANKYKESLHLGLKCKLGNDQQIKQYLSQKLLKSQVQNQSLRHTISNLQQSLSLRKQQISRIEIQLKHVQKQNQKTSQQSSLQLNKLQTELKRQRIQGEQKIRKQMDKQYKDMKAGFEQQLSKLTKTHQQLKNKFQITHDKLTNLESKDRQNTFDINTKNKQIQSYVKRLQQMKTYTLELQNKRNQDQKTIIEQRVRIQSVQSQIADKMRIIQSNTDLKSTNSHQISSLQSKNEQYKKQIQKLDTKIQSLESQLEKVQAILEDYKQKYDKKKQKNQQKNSIIKQQQRYITSKQNQIFDIKRQLQTKQKLLDQSRLDLQQRDRKISQLKRQIEQCQKKIKQDNDLITHLQKQLNQRTIGIRPTYGSYQRSTSPFSSTVSSGKQFMQQNAPLNNTISNQTTSRMKFNSINQVNNQQTSFDRNSRKDIQIKRYMPEDRERSKSPIASRVNQSNDVPSMIKPVKFKFSQKE